MEATLGSTRQQFAEMQSGEFSDEIRRRWESSRALVDRIEELVTSEQITPLIGAELVACAVGTIFGYQELHVQPELVQHLSP